MGAEQPKNAGRIAARQHPRRIVVVVDNLPALIPVGGPEVDVVARLTAQLDEALAVPGIMAFARNAEAPNLQISKPTTILVDNKKKAMKRTNLL